MWNTPFWPFPQCIVPCGTPRISTGAFPKTRSSEILPYSDIAYHFNDLLESHLRQAKSVPQT